MNEGKKGKKIVYEVTIEGVNKSTGEVVPLKTFQTEALFVIPYRKKIHNNGWFVMFQDFLKQLAKDKDLKGQDYRVLNYLLSELDWENWLQVPQRVISKETGIPRPEVAKSIKKLKEKGIIQVVRDGRSNRYRINPNLVWKGRYGTRENVIPLFRED
jgi:biotin operon repressor